MLRDFNRNWFAQSIYIAAVFFVLECLVSKMHKNQKNTPIVIGHGLKDDIISISSSENIYKELKTENKIELEWNWNRIII